MLLYTCQKLKLVARVKVCFSIHSINKVSVDHTHYIYIQLAACTDTHTRCIYTYLVSFGQQVEGHMWPSLSNVPYTTSTHITSINLSGGQQHRVCCSCVSGLEVVLISSGPTTS